MTKGPRSGPHDHVDDATQGWAVVGSLLSGIIVWGGVGWLLDHWLDTQVFTPVGVIVGAAASIYLVVVKVGK